MNSNMDPDALARLRKAAEEAAWLVARGYAPDAVSAFVGEHQKLDEEGKQLLACNSRLSAQVRHHIARELDPDDLARRPLRIDAVSVLSTVAVAQAGGQLLASSAGVICDPSFDRQSAEPSAIEAALSAVVKAARALRASKVQWLVDERCGAGLADAITREAKKQRLKSEAVVVASAVEKLRGGAYVASSDIPVLDACATWFNLAAAAIEQLDDVAFICLD